MGHAHHFLERLERLSPAHTDRALALYRDPELLEFLLSRIRLPEGAGRVALALEDREDAPHIIVTREGGFVTCLGAGMSVGDLPVVSRHATDRVAEKLDGARAILDSGEGESKRLYQRFFLANAGLSREDFGALAALMPIQAMTFISVAADMNGHVVPAHYRIQSKNRARLTPEFQQEIRAYWELTWLISALVMLISERRDDVEALSLKGHEPASAAVQAMALSCMIVGFDTPILLRASRAIASMGPPLLGFAHERLLGATDMRQMAVAGTAVCAIGLRYPRKAEEVLKLLREYRERPLSEEKHALEGIRMFIDRLIEHFDPKKRMAAEERIRKLGVSRLMEHFASQPGAAPRFERPEDVPEDLAVAAALRFSGDLLMTPESLETGALLAPWAAHSDPSLLLLPAQLQSHIPPAFDPLFVAVRAQITRDRREPVRSEKTPGRNDPCSCGSGKKYKRCCGISV